MSELSPTSPPPPPNPHHSPSYVASRRPHKLLGLELFLRRFPEWQGKVVLVQVGVPSRTKVEKYKRLTAQVHELVGRINGKIYL